MQDFNLTLDVPQNVREMSLSELVAWAGDRIKGTAQFKPIQVANVLNNIFMKMGLKLDNEQMLFLLADDKRLLCEASAGSGKTTVSQLKMVKYKLLYGISGSDILAIAYNDHAAEDMQKRHRVLIDTIMSQRIKGVKLDDRIVCRTFHSNALAWVTEYATKCNISNKETIVISDANEEKFMHKAVESALANKAKKEGTEPQEVAPGVVPALIKFNGYRDERMLDVADCEYLPPFMEIGLDVETVEETLKRFNKLCTFNSMFTFSNILVKFYELMRDNPDIRTRIQNAYKVLLVDEYQDMTPLMNAIIELMINDNTTFNAIGDGDQSIYAFKGTDSLNCLKFREYFPEGKVVSMGANRRCRKNIVDVARNILSINTLRYPKEIYAVQDGGSVLTIPYETSADECAYLVSELKKIPVDELYDVCIAYRNKESSLLLTKALLDARIPFTVKSGYEPYKDVLSASLYEIFAMLKSPLSKAYHKMVLYKLTPANRQNIAKVIDAADDSDGMKHYLDYNWSMLGNLGSAVVRELTVIKECEDALKANAPMGNYFNKLFKLFQKYYWVWMKEQRRFPDDLEHSIIRDFTTERPYSKFIKDYNEQIEIRDRFARTGIGVTVTTFHGLKGLEFSKVFLMDLDDGIFPNYKKIEIECNGNTSAELEMKEECVRLFYVACTRPKDSLVVLYNKNNPSIYIDLLRPKIEKKKVVEKSAEDLIVEDMNVWFDDMFNSAEEVQVSDTLAVFNDDDLDISIDDDDIVSNFEVPPDVTDVGDFSIPDDLEIKIDGSVGGDALPHKIRETYSDNTDEITFGAVVRNSIPRAEYRMFMYHEPSDSYYVIEKGEELYTVSSIDFACSVEISEEQYRKGLQRQELEEKRMANLTASAKENVNNKKKANNLDSVLGIFDFLNN